MTYTDEFVYLAPHIAQIFGAKDGQSFVSTIRNLVQNFDFSKIQVDVTGDESKDEEPEARDYLHTGLAPSFGTLNSEAVKNMDDKLKFIIAAAHRSLENLSEGEVSLPESHPIACFHTDFVNCSVLGRKLFHHIFMQSPYLEPTDESYHNCDKADSFVKRENNYFRIDKGHDVSVAKEVHSWFTNFIGDEDIMDSIQFDLNVFANIVATTGAAIDSFRKVFKKDEHLEKTVVDIGVLRYPDLTNPYFKVYRIRITASSNCKGTAFREENSNGITAEYNVRCFQPRSDVIEDVKDDVKKKAVAEVESLFG